MKEDTTACYCTCGCQNRIVLGLGNYALCQGCLRCEEHRACSGCHRAMRNCGHKGFTKPGCTCRQLYRVK